jgi:cytosine/uracil/thiamine/allantoin permease
VAIGNGAVGSRWHIGFPVFSRIIWGMRVCIFIPSRSKTTTN